VVEDVVRDNPDHEPGGEGPGNKIVLRFGNELLGYFHLRQNSIPVGLVPGVAPTPVPSSGAGVLSGIRRESLDKAPNLTPLDSRAARPRRR